MEINVRLEEEKDYRRVEEITRAAFGYRITRISADRHWRGTDSCHDRTGETA